MNDNKLIAEFEGLDYESAVFAAKEALRDIGHRNPEYIDNHYKYYHNCWNWLMPVVYDIESLGYDVFINGLECRITDSGQTDLDIISGPAHNKMQAIYNAVIQFITWYNTQSK